LLPRSAFAASRPSSVQLNSCRDTHKSR
jgi:hypothetical protein